MFGGPGNGKARNHAGATGDAPAAPAAAVAPMAGALNGVTRRPWSIWWDAHVDVTTPGAALGATAVEQRFFAGSYSDEATAGEAHDIATVVMGGDSARLNCPLAQQPDVSDLKALTPEAFFAALQRTAALSAQRDSKCD